MNRKIQPSEFFDFNEDHELEAVSLYDLEQERALTMMEEEDMEDFYLPPERPLKFE